MVLLLFSVRIIWIMHGVMQSSFCGTKKKQALYGDMLGSYSEWPAHFASPFSYFFISMCLLLMLMSCFDPQNRRRRGGRIKKKKKTSTRSRRQPPLPPKNIL